MQPDEALLLGGRAYGEGVPLVAGDGGDLDEDVVTRLVGEVGGSSDDQVCHLGGESVIVIQPF